MNYEKLANLLYPNVKLTVADCLKKYPQRELEKDAQVTRFAPSPTGFFHIGGLYSALIDFFTAKKSGGVFYLRLEDTDQKREIKGTGDVIVDCLKFFNVNPDEGFVGEGKDFVGAYGPYIQSKRLDLYHAFAKELVLRGKAFPCFCEKLEGIEEIREKRMEEIEETEDISQKDPCRDLSYEEIENNIKAGKPFALRLKSEGDANKTFEFFDEIRGKREIRENEKDVVLVKSNGIPPYSLAHVVDDTLMHTTTVVRGEEWYSSLSAHLEIFKALDLPHPKYAHTPVMCKIDEESGNKRKLSKRKDPESNAMFFIENGYPQVPVVEYVLNLLNSDFESWRTKNPDLPYQDFPFSLKKIGITNPMFDIVKLENYSKTYISKLSASTLYDNLLTWSKDYSPKFYEFVKENKELVTNALNIDRENPKPRKDIAKYSEIEDYFSYVWYDNFNNLNSFDEVNLNTDKRDEVIKNVLFGYADVFNLADDKQTWFDRIKAYAGEIGFASDTKAYKENPSAFVGSIADLTSLIRIALTGRKSTPDLYEIMKLLGEKRIKERLAK